MSYEQHTLEEFLYLIERALHDRERFVKLWERAEALAERASLTVLSFQRIRLNTFFDLLYKEVFGNGSEESTDKGS